MTNVSRRSIAKGAAWSVPAVVVGAPAAMAATSAPQVDCATTVPSLTDTGLKSLNLAIGTQDTYDPSSAGLAQKGTFITTNLGMWAFGKPVDTKTDKPLDFVTGYKLSVPAANSVGITSGDGHKSYAQYTSGILGTPQVIGAGLASAARFQSSVPYTGGIMSAANSIAGISIPVSVTYLSGLNPTTAGADSGTCAYYINYTFDQLGPAGLRTSNEYVSNSGNAYSITTTPQYGPAAA